MSYLDAQPDENGLNTFRNSPKSTIANILLFIDAIHVKMCIRNVISETKLNSIAVVHLKKDLKLDIDEIITKFVKIKSRKLNFYIDN